MKSIPPRVPPDRSPVPIPVETDLGSAIFDQNAFQCLLGLERKRTQRTGRPFVLMLLEAHNLITNSKDDRIIAKVFVALTGATRETDIKGWYRNRHTIGVIFTEINGSAEKTIDGALRSRVTAGLGVALPVEAIKKINLSFHCYPEVVASENGSGPDALLYPDKSHDGPGNKGSHLLKRSIDVAGSIGILIASSPVLLAVAAAIKLTSDGPVLFRQQRVGQYGRRFVFLKFRSMHVSNDDTIHKQYMQSFITGNNGGEQQNSVRTVFKMKDDPRITSVGNFLRKTSLDEFPQFWNVLIGDMSLVGPRPAIPYEVEHYQPWHKQRLSVKPGITGLWQIMGRSSIRFADMVRLDLQYAKSWTPWMDIKILFKTPKAVISGNGAY